MQLMTTKTSVLLVSFVAACTSGTSSYKVTGNSALGDLGVASIKIADDTAERTTIVALDDTQQKVGEIDLVHGAITLREDFYDGQGGQQAEGRDIHVVLRGQTFDWQTIGFTDTSHMPSIAAFFPVPAKFVADERVKSILAKWKIGWEGKAPAPQIAGETPYYATDCGQYGDQIGVGENAAGLERRWQLGPARQLSPGRRWHVHHAVVQWRERVAGRQLHAACGLRRLLHAQPRFPHAVLAVTRPTRPGTPPPRRARPSRAVLRTRADAATPVRTEVARCVGAA